MPHLITRLAILLFCLFATTASAADAPKEIPSGGAPKEAPSMDAPKDAPSGDAAKGISPRNIPREPVGFTRYIAGQLAVALPDLKLAPAGDLTLEATKTDGSPAGQLHLDRLYEFCQRNNSVCDNAIANYVGGIVQMRREESRPADKSMVRLEVRPSAYIEQVKLKLGADPAPVYARPLTPNLAIVPVLDFPRSTRFVNARDLAALGVDEAGLFKLGEDNLRAIQKPIAELLRIPPPQALGRIFDEDYAASRIIFHDDWNDLARQLRGTLVLMLPASNYLLYSGEANRDALEQLKAYGLEVATRSTRPLSPLLLKWTPTGWDEINLP
ncbi:MAG TPA: hypothetical protein VGN52_14270 [Burkholderiales bacterium]